MVDDVMNEFDKNAVDNYQVHFLFVIYMEEEF